jgi:hypothetical protein
MLVRSWPRLLARIAAFLLAAVLVIGVLAWFFALPLEARYFARKLPLLRQTPAPIRDSSVTESTGRKIAFCGSAFEIPWSDLNDAKTKTGGNSTIFYFESGLVALLKCEPPREFVEGVLSSTKMRSESFRRAFGDSAVASDYGLTRLMLETTPDAITAQDHDRQGPLMAMLVLKAMGTPPADSGIFAIHNDEFDGFQYGDPLARPNEILMSLFAADRGLEFTFFLKYQGASANVSQADINRIVRTIHKVGPYSPNSPTNQASARTPLAIGIRP